MGGRGRVGRSVEIIAECRADRRLIAFRDADFLGHGRPEAASSGIQQFRQGGDLCLEILRLPLGFGERRSGREFCRASLRMAGLGGGELVFPQFGRASGLIECRLELVQVGAGGRARKERVAFAGHLFDFGLQPCHAGCFFPQRRFECRPPRLDHRARVLRLRQRLFGEREICLGLGETGARGLNLCDRSAAAREPGCFRIKPCEDGRRVVDQRRFPRNIAGGLGDPAFEFARPAFGPPFFSVEGFPGQHQPLQLPGNFGLGASQLRQLMRGDRLQLCGFGLSEGFFGDVAKTLFELQFRQLERRRRFRPVNQSEQAPRCAGFRRRARDSGLPAAPAS